MSSSLSSVKTAGKCCVTGLATNSSEYGGTTDRIADLEPHSCSDLNICLPLSANTDKKKHDGHVNKNKQVLPK